jgi:hypothetical protein
MHTMILMERLVRNFQIPIAGKHYIPEVKSKCYWEIMIKGNKVLLVERGGPLEPIALEITATSTDSQEANLEVTDCWNWGE